MICTLYHDAPVTAEEKKCYIIKLTTNVNSLTANVNSLTFCVITYTVAVGLDAYSAFNYVFSEHGLCNKDRVSLMKKACLLLA